MPSPTSISVPLLSNHTIKFWFLELPKTHLEFLTTHQGRQRACLQLTIATAIPRKEKLQLYLKSRKAGCQGPSSPRHPQLLLSFSLMNHRLPRCAGQSLHIWVWSAEKLQELLCPASSHLTALSLRFSNPHQLFTCQPLLNGRISLWIATCTISSLHQISPVPSTGSLLSSFHPVSKHDALDNPLWTGCLKIYTNCALEHCDLQCTAEWHQ